MRRIVVINPKGGCGKTTIATNLASGYAVRGFRTALMDMDPQGSSLRWLAKRTDQQPRIVGINGAPRHGAVTRAFQLRAPSDTERLIVDTPAAVDPQRLPEVTRGADAILVPVLPSDIDIHAASRAIGDLLLIGRIDRRAGRLAVIANRVRIRTKMYQALVKFLESLQIPFVGALRDTQNYVQATDAGLGLAELPAPRVRDDLAAWDGLFEWLEARMEPPVRQLHLPLEAQTADGGLVRPTDDV
jgi:chromosome partitioning protein